MDIEELVPTFVSVTGADASTAQHYVEMANLNLDLAIQLFFEYNQAPGGANAAANQNNSTNDNPSTPNPLDYSAYGNFEEEVRAPIPTYNDCLISHPIHDSFDVDASRNNNIPTTFVGTALEEMFSNKSSDLPFQECLAVSKEEKKWVLVHIHKETEFISHQIIRDVWNNEAVNEFLNGSFQLWLRDENTSEGRNFIRLYSPASLPFVGVIDPRTGQLVKTFSVRTFVITFEAASQLSEFLENHRLDRPNKRQLPNFNKEAPLEKSQADLAASTSAQPAAAIAPIDVDTPETKPVVEEEVEEVFEVPEEPASDFVRVRLVLLDGKRIDRKIPKSYSVSEFLNLCRCLCRVPASRQSSFEVIKQLMPGKFESLSTLQGDCNMEQANIAGFILTAKINE